MIWIEPETAQGDGSGPYKRLQYQNTHVNEGYEPINKKYLWSQWSPRCRLGAWRKCRTSFGTVLTFGDCSRTIGDSAGFLGGKRCGFIWKASRRLGGFFSLLFFTQNYGW